jgi:ABC-2 type transport system permease protein
MRRKGGIVADALLATWNEMEKGLRIRWSYKFSIFTELLMIAGIFLGITFFMTGGDLQSELLAPALVGYIIWFYALIAIANMSWGLREETQTGTLEQLYMSPQPMWLLLIGRTMATLVLTTIEVVIAVTPLVLLLGIKLPWTWEVIPLGLLTLAGLYGFGYMVGGATLIFKQVESLANLMQNLLLFLNGALVPVSFLPDWLEAFAMMLPSTLGIIALRQAMFEDKTLAMLWQDGTLPALLLNTTFYFVGGLIIFTLCERYARRRGLLGQY